MNETPTSSADKYTIVSSVDVEEHIRVLKHDDALAVFDRYGDFTPGGMRGQGLFYRGTRYVSRFELRLEGFRPFLLSSSVLNDNTLLAVDLTNPDIVFQGQVKLARGAIHIFRTKFLWNGACYERLRLTNFGTSPLSLKMSLIINSDFVDLFEIRGTRRHKHGTKKPPEIKDHSISLFYLGLDEIERQTQIHCSALLGDHSERIERLSSGDCEIRLPLQLDAQSCTALYCTIQCSSSSDAPHTLSYAEAWSASDQNRQGLRIKDCRIETGNEQFNDWLNRSYADIHMMTTRLATGLYPYAGVPWYNTVFGRDGILTALSYLWVNPDLAKGVLAHLAAYQSSENRPEIDAEPGKILHETRQGEMANLKEIPFYLYYGSVDATPLFIVLAGAYLNRTGDLPFIQKLWPHVEAALLWIKKYGDKDNDGFVEYERHASHGLRNQGWKDSEDAIFHRDGSLAEGPIALCEVQGYVYDALKKAATMATALGKVERAVELSHQAHELREHFQKAFWCDDLSVYALALDGKKRPCRVRASNTGHCLYSGIAAADHAKRIAHELLKPDFFSGWGIRTIASNERRFNPMSYHNGSVWPHDNALLAQGLAHYGFKDLVARLVTGLFDSTLFIDLHRLPELFCGFPQREGEGPTHYPVACSPQAWASASVFLFVQSMIGLSFHALENKIYFERPVLTSYLNKLFIKNLHIGNCTLDVTLQQYKKDVSIDIDRREGDVDVVVLK